MGRCIYAAGDDGKVLQVRVSWADWGNDKTDLELNVIAPYCTQNPCSICTPGIRQLHD